MVSPSTCLSLSDLSHVASCAQGPSMLSQMGGCLPFSWLNNTPLCVCTTSFLSIHLLMSVWLVSISGLLWIILWLTRECRYLVEILFSFPLGINPEMELVGHMVALFLIFWGTSILFSIVLDQFTCLPQYTSFPFALHSHQNLLSSWWWPF